MQTKLDRHKTNQRNKKDDKSIAAVTWKGFPNLFITENLESQAKLMYYMFTKNNDLAPLLL